jgi:hypothetical protein
VRWFAIGRAAGEDTRTPVKLTHYQNSRFFGTRLSQPQRVRVREDDDLKSCAGLQSDALRVKDTRAPFK